MDQAYPRCLKSLALLLVAGFCFGQSGWTPGNTAGLDATVLSPSRSVKPASGAYQTKRIADIVPMDWVLAGNPENEFDLQFGDDVNPDEWLLLSLVAPKKNGGTADVRMLRPAAWLDLQWHAQQPEPISEFVCLAPLEKRLTGKTIPIHVPECGIEGDAQILSIEPCPPRRPRPGPEYRIVTATYRHHDAQVLDVYIDGEKEPIGSTPNHPFWSADLQKFVRADALHPGDRLQKADGTFTSVRKFVLRPGIHDVFNLEVQVDHVYHVAQSGVLVHNGNACPFQDIALGLRPSLASFANEVGASPWQLWKLNGLTRRDPFGQHFGRVFNNAASNARHIYFNLQGISDPLASARLGRGGFFGGNYTNAELHLIRSNPALLQKTIFFNGGVQVPSPF